MAHHGPFPLLLGTQPPCFLPPYVKGNTQSSLTPSSLPNVLPWPSALHTIHSPEKRRKNRLHNTRIKQIDNFLKGFWNSRGF